LKVRLFLPPERLKSRSAASWHSQKQNPVLEQVMPGSVCAMTKSPGNPPATPLHDLARRGFRMHVDGLAGRPYPSIRDTGFLRYASGILVFQLTGIETAQDLKPTQEIQFE
jgi:hypothetical protein